MGVWKMPTAVLQVGVDQLGKTEEWLARLIKAKVSHVADLRCRNFKLGVLRIYSVLTSSRYCQMHQVSAVLSALLTQSVGIT